MQRKHFFTRLRTALMQLNDFQSLRHNPLLPLLTGEREASPLRLQQLLLEAIESLKHGEASTRRAHEILYCRYVERISQTELSAQLGLSVRQLRREQVNATELLANLLWPKLGSSIAARSAPDDDPPLAVTPTLSSTNATAQDRGLQAEFAWLRQQFSEERGDAALEYSAAARELADLSRHHRVTMQARFPPDLPSVVIPSLVLRQTLLTALTIAMPRAANGAITVSGTTANAEVLIMVQVAGPSIAALPPASEPEPSLRVLAQLLAQFGGRVTQHIDGLLTIQIVAPALQYVTVLVVDDNPDTRLLFQRFADLTRFRVVSTGDYRQVFGLVEELHPEVILLDIMMPGVDGWDLLAQLRHHPTTEAIPVAVCSILPQAELAHFLGAAAFLQKPVSQETFLEFLQQFVTKDHSFSAQLPF